MKTLSFSVTYEPAPEGGYIASVPALPGCYSQGESLEEAQNNIKEAIELYLETLRDEHQVLPQETSMLQGRVEVRI